MGACRGYVLSTISTDPEATNSTNSESRYMGINLPMLEKVISHCSFIKPYQFLTERLVAFLNLVARFTGDQALDLCPSTRPCTTRFTCPSGYVFKVGYRWLYIILLY